MEKKFMNKMDDMELDMVVGGTNATPSNGS